MYPPCHADEYPWRGTYGDGLVGAWTETGKFSLHNEHPLDLVDYWKDEPVKKTIASAYAERCQLAKDKPEPFKIANGSQVAWVTEEGLLRVEHATLSQKSIEDFYHWLERTFIREQ